MSRWSSVRLVSLSTLGAATLVCAAFAQTNPTAEQDKGAVTSTAAASPIKVQIAPPPASLWPTTLGTAGPLGAQSVHGKPFVAEFVTEYHQNFADGNKIIRKSSSVIYRDSDGRLRRESELSIPGVAANNSRKFVTIIDPTTGYGFVLDSQSQHAHRYELGSSAPAYIARLNAEVKGTALMPPPPDQGDHGPGGPPPDKAAPNGGRGWHVGERFGLFSGRHRQGLASDDHQEQPPAFRPPPASIDRRLLAEGGHVRTESLGEQVILGVNTLGTRFITTVPAGQIGNEKPIEIVSEQWVAPELGLVMRSSHKDPWAGEFTTAAVRIDRSEQSKTLFAVPEGYKLIDANQEDENHVITNSQPQQ